MNEEIIKGGLLISRLIRHLTLMPTFGSFYVSVFASVRTHHKQAKSREHMDG
jgi:hypothetical protein